MLNYYPGEQGEEDIPWFTSPACSPHDYFCLAVSLDGPFPCSFSLGFFLRFPLYYLNNKGIPLSSKVVTDFHNIYIFVVFFYDFPVVLLHLAHALEGKQKQTKQRKQCVNPSGWFQCKCTICFPLLTLT